MKIACDECAHMKARMETRLYCWSKKEWIDVDKVSRLNWKAICSDYQGLIPL